MSITEYWKSHPEFWISIQNQEEADEQITKQWFQHDLNNATFLDYVIYLDQFTRHFSRRPETHVTEATVKETRKIAADLVLEQANITHLDEKECMFACMPLKHTEKYQECFHLIYKWLNTRPLFEFPVLSRFFQDTYKKAYVSPKPILWSTENLYDSNLICESAPPHTCGTQDRSQRKQKKLQLLLNRVQGPLLVSLSGGVDSMVMVALAQRLGLDVECVHIVYGNRSVSQQEFSLITDFCTHINVKLWVYEIEWLKRAEIDRAFYESMTRTLRFAIYKTFPNRTVLLGHIQDDVIENIWTNFAKGQHLENLAKMTSHATEDGVRIGRPWLQVDKADIYKVAEELHIPHLKKNTTPAWSNRGKFRNTFHPAITAQFGPATDKKVLEVAETLRKQSDIIQNLLYKPVLDSWVKTPTGGILDITPIQTAGGIDAHGWLHILTHISHVHCGISKPSIHACESLVSRIVRPCIITMKKDMRIHIYTKDEKWFAAVHITTGTII